MKSVLHFFRNVSSLECKRLFICDINLEGVKVEKLQANFLEQADEVNGCLEILTNGLIEVVVFPSALLSPELLQLCIDHYDIRTKSILNKDGEPMLSISRETISLVLHLPECTFATFTPTQSPWSSIKKAQINIVTSWLGNGQKPIMEVVQGCPR